MTDPNLPDKGVGLHQAPLSLALRALIARAAAVGLLIMGSAQVRAEEAPSRIDSDIHLGVASCAGSTCHGSVEPWIKSNVIQNEYVTWQG